MHFKMHKDGLHYHDTDDRQVTLVQTVQQNEAGYSQRQLATARRARDLYAKVGHPSVGQFRGPPGGQEGHYVGTWPPTGGCGFPTPSPTRCLPILCLYVAQ